MKEGLFRTQPKMTILPKRIEKCPQYIEVIDGIIFPAVMDEYTQILRNLD